MKSVLEKLRKILGDVNHGTFLEPSTEYKAGYSDALDDVEREVEKIRKEWMKKKIVPNASEVMDEVNMTCGALDVIEELIGVEEKQG